MTPQPARWPQPFILGLLLLFAAAGLWMNQAAAPIAQAAPAPNGFGPTLFLASAPPERADELFALAHPHARLSGDQPRFIASGSPDDLAKLAHAGFAVQLLDQSTTGQVYYFVDLHDDPLADPSVAKGTRLAALGRVLWADETEALVAVESGRERAFVDAAPAQDLHLALLAPDFLAPTLSYDPARSPTKLAVLQANPFVTALLDQVSSAQISTRMAELSGAQAVNLYGNAVTLGTRYTFATRIRDAERYLYQFYEQRGISVRYDDWTYGSYSGRNVIAEIPGTQHPERIWLVGGHFDSISQDPYTSAPGADDNGSGTAATLMIADILRQVQFGDTVRFVHFSGEEQGQWGSKSYARALALAGTQVMGYLDLDMIGWDGNGDRVMEIHTGTSQGSNDLGTLFMSANAAYNQQLVIERKTTSASRFSDHSPFWDNGFPAFLAIENFFVDAIPNDRNPWYHNTGDSLGRVDLSYVVRHAKVALAVLAEQAGAFTGPTPTPTQPPTATPTPRPTSTPLPTATPQPGCTDLILNGGFETGGGWSFGPTPLQAGPVTSPVMAGSHALRMGTADAASTAYSHSSAYQRVSIPTGATTVSLSFFQRPGPSADGTDYREILLLNDNLSFLRTLERSSAPGADQWQARQFDLMGERGKTVVVYFNVFNNGVSPAMVNYVDQVSLTTCVGVTATPTATATVPATATLTPTPSNIPSATLTPWATPTMTPTNTPSHTPTPESTNQPINTSTPAAYPGPPTATPTATPTLAETATPTATPTAYPEPVGRLFLPSIFARWFGSNESTATPAPTHTPTRIVGATPTSTSTSTPTLTPTPTSTPTTNPTCQELIVNGGFEANTGWSFGATPNRAGYTADPALAYAGQRALIAGIPAGSANQISYSTAFQAVAIPSGMGSVTLTLWQRGLGGDSGDYREALLLNTSYGYLARLERVAGAGSGQWTAKRFDLSARQGSTVVVQYKRYAASG